MGAVASSPLVSRAAGSGPLLAIDTSGRLCATGLFDGPIELARTVLDLGRGHAERVVEACERSLREAGMAWSDVGRIAVTIGPGSFTGIRAGVAAARGLALSLGVPATGVTTLEAMRGPDASYGAPRTASYTGPYMAPCTVALDARRGQLYAQGFAADGTALTAPVLATAAALATDPSLPTLVIGSGASLLVDAFGASGREASLVERDGHPMLDAQPDIAAVAARALRDGAPARPPAPFYLRGADAKLPGGVEPAIPAGATPAPPSHARLR